MKKQQATAMCNIRLIRQVISNPLRIKLIQMTMKYTIIVDQQQTADSPCIVLTQNPRRILSTRNSQSIDRRSCSSAARTACNRAILDATAKTGSREISCARQSQLETITHHGQIVFVNKRVSWTDPRRLKINEALLQECLHRQARMILKEVRSKPNQSSVRFRKTKKQGKVSRNDHTSHAPLVGESKTYFFKNSASYHTRTEPRTEQLTTQFSRGQPLAPKPSISSVTRTRDTLFREVMVIHIDTVALRTKGQKSVCVSKHFEEGQSQTKCKNQPRMDLIYSVTSSSPPQRRFKWSGIVMDIIVKERWRKGGRWMDRRSCARLTARLVMERRRDRSPDRPSQRLR